MTATINEKNTAEQAVYDSLPTPAEGWATSQAVAEATTLARSTVNKQLRRLSETGRVTSSSDPEVTGAKGTLWQQTATDTDGGEDEAPDGTPDTEAPEIASEQAAEVAQVDTEADETPGVLQTPPSGDVGDVAEWMQGARQVSAPPADVAVPNLPEEDRMGEAEARELTDRIKTTVRELLPLIIEAYRRRADLALGYGSWTEYCDTELAGMRMPISDRQSATRMLRQVGMSTRAIAGALGTSDATVRRDLADAPASDDAPAAPVRGLDNKEYAPKRQAKMPREVPVKVVEEPAAPPVEDGTCAYCGWAIVRRLDHEGAQWLHKASGKAECGKGHPGTFADPVTVIDGEAVDHGTVEAESAGTTSTVDVGDDPDGDIEGSDEGSTRESPHPGSGGLAVLRELLEDESTQFLLDHNPAAVAAAMEDLSDEEFIAVLARIDKATEWLGDVRSLSQLAK